MMLSSCCSAQVLGSSRACGIQSSVHAVRALGHGRQGVALVGCGVFRRCSLVGGSRIFIQQKVQRVFADEKPARYASLRVASYDIASTAVTVGTAAVLPFYALMILAPNIELTRKTIESIIPQIILVSLYLYISYLAWTPDMPRLLSTGQFMLPELNGIAELFSSRMFISAAWIHMIAVDFFAAREIFLDGLKSKIPTPHSVALCLFCCPVGILVHMTTRILISRRRID